MPTASLPLIYDLDPDGLLVYLRDWGEPDYRLRQIWQGLYQNLYDQPDQFTTIPKSLRGKLADQFSFSALTPERTLSSKDGETIKTLFRLHDGSAIEAVWMGYNKRNTLCISSQAGCAMGCVFCATGQMGFQRNLSSGEIIEQVIYYARQLHRKDMKVTNVVLMGMGEPFHNYEAVMGAIDRLNDPGGMSLGARRFTISTVGLVPGIRRFTAEKRQVNLAISLHATDESLRSSMLPVNRKYSIGELIQACKDYVEQTRRRISFEWALIQDVNDSLEQARELAHLLHGLLCHVNVIPLNPTHQYHGRATTHQRALAFVKELESLGIPSSIRLRRGIDIQAGCGQLASQGRGTRDGSFELAGG